MKKPKPELPWKVSRGTALPFGAIVSGGAVTFSTAIPDGKEASLLLYENDKQEAIWEIPLPLSERYGEVAAITLHNLNADDWDYNYCIDGEITVDPYAKAVVSYGGKKRSRIIKPDRILAKDRKPEIPYEEGVMYKLHVKGFTKHVSSGVKKKGTFKGIEEKLPYLKELGVNQLELLPIYEFDDKIRDESYPFAPVITGKDGKEKINYWGFGRGFYFALKQEYASSENAVEEFKELVAALHKAQMEVILEFYFVAATNPVLILDCLRYWTEEYHIDGFHLNGEAAPMELLMRDPLLRRTKLMTNHFPNECLREGRNGFRNLGLYHDEFSIVSRRFLKGDEDQISAFLSCMRKNPKKAGIINYITNHNGFTLQDLVSYDMKHNEANGENNQDGTDYNYSWNCGEEGKTRKRRILKLRKQQMKNAMFMLFFTQGTPLLLAGDELGNTQEGNNNAYCQDNELSWLNWRVTKMNQELLPFIKELIQIRKEHSIFHLKDEMRIMDTLSCGYPDVSYHGRRAWYGDTEPSQRMIGIMYCGEYAVAEKKKDNYFFLAFNMHWLSHTFALPSLPKGMKWEVLIQTGEDEVTLSKRELSVPERTAMILIGK